MKDMTDSSHLSDFWECVPFHLWKDIVDSQLNHPDKYFLCWFDEEDDYWCFHDMSAAEVADWYSDYCVAITQGLFKEVSVVRNDELMDFCIEIFATDKNPCNRALKRRYPDNEYF